MATPGSSFVEQAHLQEYKRETENYLGIIPHDPGEFAVYMLRVYVQCRRKFWGINPAFSWISATPFTGSINLFTQLHSDHS